MELTLKEPKNTNVPCRALPEEILNTQIAYFCHWLELLLGVQDKKENEKRVMFLFKHIKEIAWGLSIAQLKEAFEMYVDGKLSENGKYLEPISGFIDTVLFKKVVRAYKQEKAPKMDMRPIALATYDYWLSNKKLEKQKDDKKYVPVKGVVETFDYLVEKGLLPKKDQSEKIKKKYAFYMTNAKGRVYAWYLENLKWLKKEELGDTPKAKEIRKELQMIRDGSHKEVLPKFKQLVLEGYFKKIKRPLGEVI